MELIDGIRVIRIWTYISANHGFIKRVIDYFSFAVTGFLGVEGHTKEIVDTYSAGVCIEPKNREDFLSNVKTIKEDGALYQSLQVGCEKLAADYQCKNLGLKMLSVIYDIANIRRNPERDKSLEQMRSSWFQRNVT